MRKVELGEHLYAFFHSPLLKKEAAMAFWALAWQKTSSVQTCLAFLAQKSLEIFVRALWR
jgi:hypothetical protein